jgi:hypothetical protein
VTLNALRLLSQSNVRHEPVHANHLFPQDP